MAQSNFTKIFLETSSKIEAELRKIYKLKFQEEKMKSFDSKRQKDLLENIQMYKKLISEAQQELSTLDVYAPGYRSDYPLIPTEDAPRESDVSAYGKLLNDSSFTNILEFQKIREKYLTAMNLSINEKKRREFLLKFFTLDWKSLGIDIPLNLNFENMSIKNGNINSGSKLLN